MDTGYKIAEAVPNQERQKRKMEKNVESEDDEIWFTATDSSQEENQSLNQTGEAE